MAWPLVNGPWVEIFCHTYGSEGQEWTSMIKTQHVTMAGRLLQNVRRTQIDNEGQKPSPGCFMQCWFMQYSCTSYASCIYPSFLYLDGQCCVDQEQSSLTLHVQNSHWISLKAKLYLASCQQSRRKWTNQSNQDWSVASQQLGVNKSDLCGCMPV